MVITTVRDFQIKKCPKTDAKILSLCTLWFVSWDNLFLGSLLIQQLGLDNQEKPPVNYKQQAKEIIAETISEVLALSNDCEEEVWQKFYVASGRISAKLNESDFL